MLWCWRSTAAALFRMLRSALVGDLPAVDAAHLGEDAPHQRLGRLFQRQVVDLVLFAQPGGQVQAEIRLAAAGPPRHHTDAGAVEHPEAVQLRPAQLERGVRLIQLRQGRVQDGIKVAGRIACLDLPQHVLHGQRAAHGAADAVAVHGILGQAPHHICRQQPAAVILHQLGRITADVAYRGAGLGHLGDRNFYIVLAAGTGRPVYHRHGVNRLSGHRQLVDGGKHILTHALIKDGGHHPGYVVAGAGRVKQRCAQKCPLCCLLARHSYHLTKNQGCWNPA